MRRKRHQETKVWRDPRMSPMGGNGAAAEQQREVHPRGRQAAPAKRRAARIIASPAGPRDAKEIERKGLLDRVLVAEGRRSISAAVEAYYAAGFTLPTTQQAWLQLLEHNDEARVTEAIAHLTLILEEEEPERRRVLESRLRRLEEFADEPTTQRAASDLRRILHTRHAETLT